MSTKCTYRLLLALVLMFSLTGAAQSAVVYVSLSGDGTTGLSWASAKNTVQAGIDAASAGDQVWVAKGYYYESITMKDGVALYGGFKGTETTLSQRLQPLPRPLNDPNITHLLGDHIGSTVTVSGATLTSTRIDGFSIEHGISLYDSMGYKGAAIDATNSTVTVTNNTVTENSVASTSKDSHSTIRCMNGTVTITRNLIIGNRGYCIIASGCQQATISSNLIMDNVTLDTLNPTPAIACGGGSYIISYNRINGNGLTGISLGSNYDYPLQAQVYSNIIASNSYGGITCAGSLTATIVNNTIVDNIGTGVEMYSDYQMGSPSVTLSNNIIAFNELGVRGASNPGYDNQNNCVYNNTSGDYLYCQPGSGDISQDPKLLDRTRGDYHLQTGSPCINAGCNTDVSTAWTDYEGERRIQPTGGIVDIGADEYSQPPTIPATQVIRVSTSGDDVNNGSTWALAKKTIRAAIEALMLRGGEVWVAAGTYPEYTVEIPVYINVYGGFAGNETDKTARNWTVNKTIIDGYNYGTVVRIVGGSQCSRIDGFTICRGKGIVVDNTTGLTVAGGIFTYGSPIITHNTITQNILTQSNFDNALRGAGIYCGPGTPQITFNTISDNQCIAAPGRARADRVGTAAIYASGTAVVANNIITRNYSPGVNGTITGASSIVNNVIVGNTAELAAAVQLPPKADVINNTIVGNYSGAISGLTSTTGIVANNIIAYNNSARSIPSTMTSRKNCVYGNGLAGYSGTTYGATDITADPKLVSWQFGQAHLMEGSPCIDAGDSTVADLSLPDIDGDLRPSGSSVDIGADEYTGAAYSFSPKIIRVSKMGNDANDGSDWSKAKLTIKNAIAAVPAEGAEIWVAKGTYVENLAVANPYVHIYGGFSGGETARSERNWTANQTTIDGNQVESVVKFTAVGYGMDSIDGFTIQNGKGQATYSGTGAGVHCLGSGPFICNNIIKNNSTGGLYLSGGLAQNNTITGNTWCGIRLISGTVVGNTISFNTGGGICKNPDGSATISNNVIANNTCTGNGGGIYCYADSVVVITGNTIVANTAAGSGGPIYMAASETGAQIRNNIFAFNTPEIKAYNVVLGTWSNNLYFGNGTWEPYVGDPAPVFADPLFVDKNAGDYRLTAQSPAINKGTNTAIGIPVADLNSEPRVQGGTVDIGADEFWGAAPKLSSAKMAADNATVEPSASIVTAGFEDFFYIESTDRTSGIRVDKAGSTVRKGDRVFVAGKAKTNTNGERYIAADSIFQSGSGVVKPLSITVNSLGGARLGNQDATSGFREAIWQQSSGLNNIGLLVRSWGRVECRDGSYYLTDGSGNEAKLILPSGTQIDPTWQVISVTGISTCEKSGSDLIRAIRIARIEDIAKLQ